MILSDLSFLSNSEWDALFFTKKDKIPKFLTYKDYSSLEQLLQRFSLFVRGEYHSAWTTNSKYVSFDRYIFRVSDHMVGLKRANNHFSFSVKEPKKKLLFVMNIIIFTYIENR